MPLTENSGQIFLPGGFNRTQNLRFGPYTSIHVTQVAALLTIYSSVNTISVILQTLKLAHFASGLTMRHCLLIYGAILMQQRMTICIIGIQK